MKNLNVSQPLSSGTATSRFAAFHQHPRRTGQRDDLQNRRRGLRAARRLDQQVDLSGRRFAGRKLDY